jgi:ABC-type sugar transport system permease subunit
MQSRSGARAGAIFLAPALVALCLFTLLPVVFAIRLSLDAGTGFKFVQWVGLDNYARLFADTNFLDLSSFPPSGALVTTIMWAVVALPTLVALGLLIAVASDGIRFERVFKTVFFVPIALSGTVIGVLWLFVLAPVKDIGLLNAMLGTDQPWLGDPATVNWALMFAFSWANLGYSVIILSAAVKSVPEELMEAARIDGANGWQVFRNVTLPSIRLPLGVVVTTNLIAVFRVFDIVFVMTRGGPAGLSRTLAYFFYDETFRSGDPAYGSTIVVVLSSFILLLMVISQRLTHATEVD